MKKSRTKFVYNFDSIIAQVKNRVLCEKTMTGRRRSRLPDESKRGRKLLIWGAWEIGYELAKALKENNLELYAYVDSNHYGEDYQGYSVISPDALDADNRSEYYLIVSLVEHASVYKTLEEKQWKEFEDFIYLGKTVTLTSCKNHLDVYGNQIESKVSEELEIKMACGSRLIIEEGVHFGKNVRIEVTMLSEIRIQKDVFIPDNSYIRANCKGRIIIGSGGVFGNNLCINVHSDSEFVLGSKCQFDNNLCINVYSNSQFVLGSDCQFGRNADIRSGTNGIAIIDENCEFKDGVRIEVARAGKMRIGSHSTFGIDTIIRINNAAEFECGFDCMFSYCTRIRGEDGHTIIDMNNHKIMERKKNVKLGNHVWVGLGVTLIPGAKIGDNSIIGANSMVNHSFPSNCIIIGTPARIHKTGVTWDRNANITYEEWASELSSKRNEMH